ncbi:hypothetical protein CIRG_01636 [Coccidioides immitis RMSCC 2394]|uniref:Uncharacterized protein n=1 Tax=Coccidioides immitis RMSCC 2394 TaxID=404692 RepID=A0A0J7AVY1_COCIT|nr:hypothetical protein CIRG_01636 [Coccidioides immitis RMSCC 2394]
MESVSRRKRKRIRKSHHLAFTDQKCFEDESPHTHRGGHHTRSHPPVVLNRRADGRFLMHEDGGGLFDRICIPLIMQFANTYLVAPHFTLCSSYPVLKSPAHPPRRVGGLPLVMLAKDLKLHRIWRVLFLENGQLPPLVRVGPEIERRCPDSFAPDMRTKDGNAIIERVNWAPSTIAFVRIISYEIWKKKTVPDTRHVFSFERAFRRIKQSRR